MIIIIMCLGRHLGHKAQSVSLAFNCEALVLHPSFGFQAQSLSLDPRSRLKLWANFHNLDLFLVLKL